MAKDAAKVEPEVVEVTADFSGVAEVQNLPQAPTPEEVVNHYAADVLEFIAAQQRRINELEIALNQR